MSIEDALRGPSQTELANVTLPKSRRSRRHKSRAGAKRLDIQGLRAVAVVAVVVNHLTGHPQGGFVGVDVFFVISGYLMTTILMREQGRYTPNGFVGWFYARRIRRLVPAALVTTMLTVVVAHSVFSPARFNETRIDAGWVTIFWANWHFINVGADYFSASLPPSPFEHYWSLSVEEQFYIVLPWVLLLATGGAVLVVRARGDRAIAVRRWGSLAVSVLVLVVSLCWAAHESHSNPVEAYFSTLTRLWELTLGGVVAVLIRYMRCSTAWLTFMSWTGLSIIAISLFAVDSEGFPFPGAIAPCLGSALVVMAASPNGQPRNCLLTNRAAVFVGDISYSVYLTHFPILILLGAYMPHRGSYYYAAVALLTLGLSTLLYAGVERPILDSKVLLPRRAHRTADHSGVWRMFVAGAFVAAVGFSAITLWPGDQAAENQAYAAINSALTSSAPASSSTTASPAAPVQPQQAKLTSELRAALAATSWPKLSPEPGADGVQNKRVHRCTAGYEPPSECTWGNRKAPHSMYLVGDSTSGAYTPGLIGMVLATPGWKIRPAGGAGCPFATKLINTAADNPFRGNCLQRNAQVKREIIHARPDVVVETSSGGTLDALNSIRDELLAVRPYVKKIVILPAPPGGPDPQDCFTPTSPPVECIAKAYGPGYQSYFAAEQKLAAEVGGTYIATTSWFCVESFCPEFAGSTSMRHDSIHLTDAYSRLLAPVMRERFVADGILPNGHRSR